MFQNVFFKLTIGLLAALILLTACGGDEESTVAPLPTPLIDNADWTPVIQTFNEVEMVQVPAGCFKMGHTNGRRDERPVNQICFAHSFWIDRYEVTNAQYGSRGAFAESNRPRDNLTWFEARDFCVQRGARLPTEAEWEYAARGPNGFLYPWGNELQEHRLVFDRNSNNETAEVGSRPEGISWVGAYDMAGNVWEWVNSIYLPYPYSAEDGRENPDDTTSRRVLRGGLGSYIDDGVSAAKRFRAFPDKRDWFIGFRCARDF